jgi:hypothetical protein
VGPVPVEGGFFCRALLTAAGCLLICFGSGCGGDYGQKVEDWSGNTVSPASSGTDLWASEPIADTAPTLNFCRPRIFTGVPMANGVGDERKSKPKLLELPGLKLTCEAFEKLPDNSGNQGAFYCYVAAVPAAAGEKDKLANEFKTKLTGQANKSSLDDWADFPVDAADGKKVWRKLRYTGAQEFCVKDKDGKETFPSMPGVFEVYMLEESGSIVILAWRVPLSLE